jgi:pimeloyl-ACP methyl ester carboxylesterase
LGENFVRRRWLRRLTIALAALLVVAVGVWCFAWRPVRPAAAFLSRLSGPEPDAADLKAIDEVLEDGKREWGLLPPSLVLEGPVRGAPLVIVVAGVTPKGIDDSRVRRLALALRDAGFAVLAPEVRGLARAGEDEHLVEDVVVAWSAALSGRTGQTPRGHVAFLGVSLGGGLVLRALAAGGLGDPSPSTVSAVFLVGSPDDATALAPEWFHRAAAEKDADTSERQRAGDGRFARHGILRAAIPALIAADAERTALRAWLDPIGEDFATNVAEPTGISSPEARRWLAAARAEGSITDADLAWVLPAAKPFLDATSPARIPPAGLARISMPVFLIHGEADPLVPVTEMSRLAARLSASASVHTLSSHLIAHVEIESPGLLETWRHLRFVQDFFDVAAAAR